MVKGFVSYFVITDFAIAFTLLIHDKNKMIWRNVIVTLYVFFFVNVTLYKFNDKTFKIFFMFRCFANLLQTDNEIKSVKTIYN